MSSSTSEVIESIESHDGAPNVRDLREWLDSLRTEWDVVTAYVGELRKLLEPDDVEAAMAVCGIDPTPLLQDVEDAPTADAYDTSGPIVEAERSAVSSAASGSNAPAKSLLDELANADEASINRRLVEVLALLQQNLETIATDAKRQVSVPPEVTQAIAKEVAGRVQQTLTSGGAATGSTNGEGERVGSYWAGGGADEPFRRIPLDDIESVIDELIRNS